MGLALIGKRSGKQSSPNGRRRHLRRRGSFDRNGWGGEIVVSALEVAKWVCVILFVASTVGVIVGVYWEGEKFGKEKQHRGWLLLLACLAAETFFSVLIFA